MNADTWERIAKLEQQAGINDGGGALVFWRESLETREDLDARIKRWQAGEKVEGVSCEYSDGMGYRVIKFVKNEGRNEPRH